MIDAELIFEKEISICNEASEFIIAKGSKIFTLTKTSKPKLQRSIKKEMKTPPQKIYGVVGVLSGLGTDYLMVISRALLVGLFFKSKICQIDEISFLPFDKHCENHLERNKDNFKMINDFLSFNTLYFSNAYNLTSSVIDNFNKPPLITTTFLNTIKSQFCWNFHFISSIEFDFEFSLSKDTFIYPVINGFIGIRLVNGYEKELNYMLISRKDCRRSGVRFLKRGCDLNGTAANYTETEQVVSFLEEDNYNILSYTQVRGSIPLLWSQPSEMQFVPKIHIQEDYNKQVNVYKKHLNELIMNYGDVTMVNLIDKKGDQNKIGELFQNVSNETKDEIEHSFVWFDFHHECRKMKYENLNKLLKKEVVSSSLDKFNFSHIQVPSTFSYYEEYELEIVNINSQQVGIIRTNCIDSLDRTNVVQTLFARNVLHQMLSRVKLNKQHLTGDAFEPFSKYLEKIFRNAWADNGDAISKSYSGTSAQKGDFTRHAQRTTQGAVSDLCISGTRYYLNNFRDGYRQDCNDYFLGVLNPFNFVKRKNTKYFKIFFYSLPTITFLLFLFARNLIVPTPALALSDFPFKEKIWSVFIFFVSLIITSKSLFSFLGHKMYDRPSSSL